MATPNLDTSWLRVKPAPHPAPRTHWESRKSQRTLSLTEEVWDLLGALAERNESNRSEVVEVVVRTCVNNKIDVAAERESLLIPQKIAELLTSPATT